jgi:hypothetical protein
MATAENIWAWSTTAASNDAADSSVNWAEGQDPATVNNSARSMMAAQKKMANVQSGNVTVAGTADAITITTGQAISTGHQALGFRICFKAAATNTGAATVAVDGLAAVAIKRPNNDALSAGDIISGAFHDIAFDGTNYRLFVPGAGGNYGSLSGANTWSGTNTFQGTTAIGDDAGDAVAIKGNVVSLFGSAMLAASSASAWRVSLGLGTAAEQNTGTSGATVPLLNGANTWSSNTTMSRNSGTASDAPLVIARPDGSVAGATAWYQEIFTVGGIVAGSITSRNLGLGSADTAFNTTSDERLKHASTSLDDSGAIIDQLAPTRFRWGSDDGLEDFGFSAQALHAVVPQAVTPGKGNPGDKDYIPWMREKGALEAILVAEIKDLRRRVAELEARLDGRA